MVFLVSCSSSQPNREKQNSEVPVAHNDKTVQGQRTLTLDDGLKDLSSQIYSLMAEGQKQKIAVIEFSDLDGRITDFGKFLSEELITRLFTSRKFDVIERQLLNKILAEHKLNVTGLIDESTAKELGKILGVDAICSGTITDLINSVKINARLISTETGTIFAVAAVPIQMDDVIRILLNKTNTNNSQSKLSRGDNPSTNKKLSNIFFEEDFSNVQDGLLPKGWSGGEKMGIKSEGQKKFLTDLIRGDFQHKIFIDDIEFPDNFEVEFFFHFGDYSPYASSLLSIEGLKITFNRGGNFMLGPASSNKSKGVSDTDVWIKIWKIGSVFKLFVDGEEYAMCRLPDFQKPKSILMEFSRLANIKLYKITGRKLD